MNASTPPPSAVVTPLSERRPSVDPVAEALRELRQEVAALRTELAGWEARELLTAKDLERILRLSPRAVRYLLNSEKIASHKVGGARRIDPADLRFYLAANRSEGKS